MDTDTRPKAWIDAEYGCVMFRRDVPLDEANELEAMIRAAFNAGLASGHEQGYKLALREYGAR